MQVTSSYNGATLAGQVSAASITTAETDVLVVSDMKYPQKSQLTLYFDVDLSGGTITSARFHLFFSYDSPSAPATTWYPVPIQNLSTGQLFDTPIIIDSNAYAYAAGKYREVYDIPMSSAMQFKVTVIGIGAATATLNTLTAVVRDN
jgi:hypothetical protein